MKVEIIKNETDPKNGYSGIHLKCGAREAYFVINPKGGLSVAAKTFNRFGYGHYHRFPAEAMDNYRSHEMKLMIAEAAKLAGRECPIPMPPPEKKKLPPVKGIKLMGLHFGKDGIRDAAGNYVPVYYGSGTDGIHISARHYERLPACLNPTNGSDIMTDYFENDRALIKAGTPEHAALLPLVEAITAHRKAKYA